MRQFLLGLFLLILSASAFAVTGSVSAPSNKTVLPANTPTFFTFTTSSTNENDDINADLYYSQMAGAAQNTIKQSLPAATYKDINHFDSWSAAAWNSAQGTWSQETAIKKEGTGSFKCVSSNTSTKNCGIYINDGTNLVKVDLTAFKDKGKLGFWLYSTQNTNFITAGTYLNIGSTYNTNWKGYANWETQITTANGWNFITVDLNAPTGSAGTISWSDINYFEFALRNSTAQYTIYLDKMYAYDSNGCNYDGNAQKTITCNYLFSPNAGQYYADLNVTSPDGNSFVSASDYFVATNGITPTVLYPINHESFTAGTLFDINFSVGTIDDNQNVFADIYASPTPGAKTNLLTKDLNLINYVDINKFDTGVAGYWVAHEGTWSIETIIKKEGTGSAKCISSNEATKNCNAYINDGTNLVKVDLTPFKDKGKLGFWLYSTQNTNFNNSTSWLDIGSTYNTNYKRYTNWASQITTANGWNLITIDLNAPTNSAGTISWADINFFEFYLRNTAAQYTMYLDKMFAVDTNASCDYNGDASKGFSCKYNFAALSSKGNYYIDLNVYDTDHNGFVSGADYFTIPNNAPKPTTSWDGNHNVWQNMDANIHLACHDSGSGCASTMYRLDTDAGTSIVYGSWATFDKNILVKTDGNYAIDFNSTDTMGFIGDTNTFYVLIDKTIPTISSVTINYGFNLEPAVAFDLNAVISDAGSGMGAVTAKCYSSQSSYGACTSDSWDCKQGLTLLNCGGNNYGVVVSTVTIHDTNGTWTCRVDATDALGSSSNSTDTETMLDAIGVTVDATSGDYSSLYPNTTANQILFNTANPYIIITHNGNREINLMINCGDLTAAGSKTIPKENHKWGTTNLYASSTSCNGANQNIVADWNAGTYPSVNAKNNYLWLDVPIGQALGAYAGTVAIGSSEN